MLRRDFEQEELISRRAQEILEDNASSFEKFARLAALSMEAVQYNNDLSSTLMHLAKQQTVDMTQHQDECMALIKSADLYCKVYLMVQ